MPPAVLVDHPPSFRETPPKIALAFKTCLLLSINIANSKIYRSPMPNYEPTPRRFSIISVPRSASRRNSIDDVANPTLHVVPGFSKPSSPVDLAGALRHLQHVESSPERERGRTRQVGGDNAMRAIWGHDGMVTAPSARRESSASTRERIAMWEERSRSQSKGRSKGGERDIGSRHRVSVVPEVPELSAAFAGFEEEEIYRRSVGSQGTESFKQASGMRDEVDLSQSTTEPGNTAQGGLERLLGTTSHEEHARQFFDQMDRGTWTAALLASGQPGLDAAKVADPGDERPRTPVRQIRHQPLTPETTPQSLSRSSTFGEERKEPAEFRPPSTPTSGMSRASGDVLPLTPQATPEQTGKEISWGHDYEPASPENYHVRTSPGDGYTAVFQPKIHQQNSTGVATTQPVSQYHLPPGLLAEDPPRQVRDVSSERPSRTPMNNSHAPQNQKGLAEDAQHRYHGVWRINRYQPDFPLPDRPSDHMNIQTLEQSRLAGNPLQELPRGQLPAESRNHQAIDPSPYPYARPLGAVDGDWVVNIPPSPSAAYLPGEHSVPSSRTRRGSRANTDRYLSRSDMTRHEWDAPPVIERALHAASVSMMQGLNVPVEVYRGIRDTYYPAPGRPNIIKAYPIRRRLPVRIFFPSHHDLTSPALLPTLFTIHGGAFTVGYPADDDVWNRTFADSYTILVIALNYAKAPWAAFPSPILDVEALYHAILNDESLPIDRMRVALAGFDAGANLALALSQLPSVRAGIDPNPSPFPQSSSYPPRSNPPPTAVISIAGILDFTTPPAQKLPTRRYKCQLRGPRGWGPGLDWMARLLPSSAWSYIPYGHDASDPLLSPLYSARQDLPPHVFVIAAELDCLAMESWRAVCRWAGRVVPGHGEKVGREAVAVWRGCLDDGRGEDKERFGWCEVNEGRGGERGSTRWLLVPDVVHGFDSAGWRSKSLWADEIARMDAEMKTIAYQREMAEWLWGVVW